MIFETIKTGEPTILHGFHYQDLDEDNIEVLTKDNIEDREFYFSDEPISWYADHLPGHQRLYMMTVFLSNPIVILELEIAPEYRINADIKDARKNLRDSIIYTVKEPLSQGLRQGILLNPKESIVNIKQLKVPVRR